MPNRESWGLAPGNAAGNRGGLRRGFGGRGIGWPETNNRKVQTMKTFINKLLKGRFTRWAFLAMLLTAVGATVGWKDAKHSQRQYQLGGGFIGTSPGLVWNCVQTPLDPAGRTAALVEKTVDDDGSQAALLEACGADTGSDAVGEDVMISRDTANWSMAAYAQVAGPPLQTKAIFVYTGTLKFTDRDNFVINYTLNVYVVNVPDTSPFYGLPNADADHDGFPDEGATPALTIPDLTGTGKRVPVP